MSRSKNYKESKKLITKKTYPLGEAIEVVKKTAKTKFDSSIELHIKLNLGKKGDHSVRTTVDLPNPTGKKVRVAVFAEKAKHAEIKKAGAEVVGEDDLVEKVSKGFCDFEVAIATPTMMKKMGKLGKVLGQKGLMPNPKAGTISKDPAKLVAEFQKGKIEIRADKEGSVHQLVGKVSFDDKKLSQNILAIYHAVLVAKPEGLKGNYLASVHLASTMGPSIKVDVSSLK
ncbi:50S ribosomal protein L1 [Patescibacteria group bacterium]